MKKILIFTILITSLFACKNNDIQMSDYTISDQTISYKIPSYMHKTKEDNSSVLFEGNNKLVNLMWTSNENGWNLERFAQHFTKDNDELTLVEKNDTVITYEIQKGAIKVPALAFSLHKRKNNSIIIMTMGIATKERQAITNSIK